MSSYIVEDRTINAIVSHLWHDRAHRHIKQQLPVITEEELGEELYKLNLAAVENRYGDYAAGEMCDLDYTYRRSAAHISKIQAIKSLSCWLYQCSEGQVPEAPLFKLMEKYRGALAMDVVRAQREWETSTWG